MHQHLLRDSDLLGISTACKLWDIISASAPVFDKPPRNVTGRRLGGYATHKFLTVSQAENSIILLKLIAAIWAKLFNLAPEFDAQDISPVRQSWVVALPLHGVHSIQPKGLDSDEDFVFLHDWIRNAIFDEEGIGVAFAVFDAYCSHVQQFGSRYSRKCLG
jgi:hypothetical protein